MSNEKTILILDNQQCDAIALAAQLGFIGFKTRIAYTATGAINKIKESPPDIILLNVGLSDRDVMEVISFIRKESTNCLIPVIAISSFLHMKEKCIQAGCSDFFYKPIKPLDLVVRIRKALA